MKQPNKINFFLKATAICSFLGALTTTALIFLPSPEASDFESQVLLFKNNLYLSKLWILFLHPQVNLLAIFGIAYLLKIEDSNFKINRKNIKSVSYYKRKKWRMGNYPHDGKIYIETENRKKKEFIILGSQSGKEIKNRIEKK